MEIVFHTHDAKISDHMRRRAELSILAMDLVWILRDSPSPGRLINTLEHMWAHVRDRATSDDLVAARTGAHELLTRTQQLALRFRETFLLSSTALSELAVFTE